MSWDGGGKDLLGRSEAMELLGVGWRRFKRLIGDGVVRPRKWGGKGRCVFARKELEEVKAGVMEECEVMTR